MEVGPISHRRSRALRIPPLALLVAALVLPVAAVVLLPIAAQAVPGLSERPTNLTCVAPPRPPSGSQINGSFSNFVNGVNAPTAFVQSPIDDEIFYLTTRGGTVERVNIPSGGSISRTTLLDLSSIIEDEGEGGLLNLVLHPDFENNGELFIYYTRNPPNPNPNNYVMTSVIARYTSSDGGQTLDPGEDVLFELGQPGFVHNGGGMGFSPLTGYLHVSFGDGGGSQGSDKAQDPNSYFGKMLRIDVDGASPYAIPPSNPFASGGGLPEIYALGFRNPWRFSFDINGDLWLGDVGQDNWEEVDFVELGHNYGWPIREGKHCFPPGTGSCNTAGLTDPVSEFSHVEGNAIIGGFVYRGSDVPALSGTYVFSSLNTGEIYGLFFDGMGDPINEVLGDGARTNSLAQDRSGEVYLLGNDTIYKFGPAGGSPPPPFPQLLSLTGCVDPQDPTQPASGLIPYTVNVPFWSDGADKERWLALPDATTIDLAPDGDFEFPIGTVLMKNFRLNGQLFETRLFVRHDDGGWAGYTYEWDPGETDAVLLASNKQIEVQGQTWEFPSRQQCLECHVDAANDSLGPETLQLNGDLTYPSTGLTSNQLETLEHIGLFTSPLPSPPPQLDALPDTADLSVPLNLRARAYLHSNCGGCHRPGTGVEAEMDLRYQADQADLDICNVSPIQGIDVGVTGAKLLVPGDPSMSLLSLRMNRRDTFQMAPVGSLEIDTQGVALIDAWINSWLVDGQTCLGPDSDGDGAVDADDNCDNVHNPLQTDTDMDGIGDACEPADLAIQDVTGPASATLGEHMTVDSTAENLGQGNSGSPVNVTIYLSDDTTIDPLSDTEVGACSTGSLTPGASAPCSDSDATVPIGLAEIGEGETLPFFWGACADVADAEPEEDENNNCTAGNLVLIPEPSAGSLLCASALTLLLLARRRQASSA